MATKTPEQIATAITEWSTRAIEEEAEKRKKLADAATSGTVLGYFNLNPVLEAQAAALPWRHVTQRIENGASPAEALQQVREDATVTLLERTESQSTSALSNDIDRMEREALRRFLRQTARLAG